MESHSVIAFPFKTEIKNQFLQISLTYCLLKLSIIISLVFLATNNKKKKILQQKQRSVMQCYIEKHTLWKYQVSSDYRLKSKSLTSHYQIASDYSIQSFSCVLLDSAFLPLGGRETRETADTGKKKSGSWLSFFNFEVRALLYMSFRVMFSKPTYPWHKLQIRNTQKPYFRQVLPQKISMPVFNLSENAISKC